MEHRGRGITRREIPQIRFFTNTAKGEGNALEDVTVDAVAQNCFSPKTFLGSDRSNIRREKSSSASPSLYQG